MERFEGNVGRRVVRLLGYITVEPILATYMFAFMLISVIEQDFFFIKICTIDLRLEESLCRRVLEERPIDAFNSSAVSPTFVNGFPVTRAYMDEIKVSTQKILTSFHETNSTIGNVISLLVALVIAQYGDRCSRKFLIVVSLCGKIVYTFGLLLVSMIPKLNVHLVTVLSTFPSSFFGGESIIFACCFAYIADITSEVARSSRIVLLDFAYLIAIPLGLNCGSFLFYHIYAKSYTLVFLTNLVLIFGALIYAILRLNKTFARHDDNPTSTTLSDLTPLSTSVLQISSISSSLSPGRSSNPKSKLNGSRGDAGQSAESVRENERTPANVRPSSHSRRTTHRRCWNLPLLLLASALYSFHRSEKTVTYMYTQLQFGWNLERYTLYKTTVSVVFLTCLLATFLLLRRFSAYLKDEYLALTGCLSHTLARVLYVTTSDETIFFAGGIVSGFGPLVSPAIKAIVSKITPPANRGRMFTYVSIVDTSVPLVSSLLYLRVYRWLAHSFADKSLRSRTYLLTIVSQLACAICVLLFILTNSRDGEAKPEAEDLARLRLSANEDSASTLVGLDGETEETIVFVEEVARRCEATKEKEEKKDDASVNSAESPAGSEVSSLCDRLGRLMKETSV